MKTKTTTHATYSNKRKFKNLKERKNTQKEKFD